MSFTTLISTAELAQHLTDPKFVIVDCRFDLLKPEWGHSEYLTAHIPGAVYADLNLDLAGPKTPASGRHPLPDPKAVVRTFSAWGIDAERQVIAYDTTGGSIAARLWWLLRYYGHAAVAVLDGSLQKWTRENLPMAAGPVSPTPRVFVPGAPLEKVFTTAQIETLIDNPETRLVDARAEPRFTGEQETIDPVSGHIPGAINRFYGLNLGPDGTFLSPEELKRQFNELLAGTPTDQAIVYCGSGITSCHHLVAMHHAGLPESGIYVGSWSEWIRDPRHPIASGKN